MILLPFSRQVAEALRRRHAEYLEQADAAEAETGVKDTPDGTYVKALTFVVVEVLCNVLFALRAMRGPMAAGEPADLERLRTLALAALDKVGELEAGRKARDAQKGPPS